MLRVLLVGAGGQLGQALTAEHAAVQDRVQLYCATHAELDITDVDATERFIAQLKPNVVINAAAYTAVDKAEQDINAAFLLNDIAAKNLAECCHRVGSKLLHISTDFVFSGSSKTAWLESDKTEPLSVYGKSKLAGEQAILSVLSSDVLIVRTSWLFSEYANNFVKTMRAKIIAGDALTIVNDQVGSPTYAAHLAKWLWFSVLKLAEGNMQGVYHAANAKECSWFELTQAINECLGVTAFIKPISTAEYIERRGGVIAPRPAYSVLNTDAFFQELGIQPSSWQQALHECMERF